MIYKTIIDFLLSDIKGTSGQCELDKNDVLKGVRDLFVLALFTGLLAVSEAVIAGEMDFEKLGGLFLASTLAVVADQIRRFLTKFKK